MTSPVASVRPKTARTLAALAATAIVGVLSPVASAAPAVAAPADAACQRASVPPPPATRSRWAASPTDRARITVLPGRNGHALLRINAVESATVTGVGSASGCPAATAAATGGIADFKLLDNGPSAIGSG
jgi:hypothetical protein